MWIELSIDIALLRSATSNLKYIPYVGIIEEVVREDKKAPPTTLLLCCNGFWILRFSKRKVPRGLLR